MFLSACVTTASALLTIARSEVDVSDGNTVSGGSSRGAITVSLRLTAERHRPTRFRSLAE